MVMCALFARGGMAEKEENWGKKKEFRSKSVASGNDYRYVLRFLGYH